MFIDQLSLEERAFVAEPYLSQIKSQSDFNKYISILAKIAKTRKIPEEFNEPVEVLGNIVSRFEEPIKTESIYKVEASSISKIKALTEILWPKYCKHIVMTAPKEAIGMEKEFMKKYQIIPNLFIGSALNALRSFKSKMYDYILSLIDLAPELEKLKITSPPKDVKHTTLEINSLDWDILIQATSSDPKDQKKWFDKAFPVIDEALAKGNSIIIHCNSGAVRSPTLIIAYLMKRKKYSYEEAYEKVRKGRPQIEVNEATSMRDGLLDYSKYLRSRKSKESL